MAEATAKSPVGVRKGGGGSAVGTGEIGDRVGGNRIQRLDLFYTDFKH